MRNLKLRDIEYNEDMVLELESAMKNTKKLRLYKRYSIILKHLQGFTNRAIADMENLEVHAVGKYIKDYKLKGIEGLEMKSSPGAPRKLNTEQELKLIDIVTLNTPDEVGFECKKNWTIELIRQWVITNFNIVIKHSSMAVILHRLNLSYTRPTYVLAKADEKKQEIFKEDFEALKKHLNGEVDHILFQDEYIYSM